MIDCESSFYDSTVTGYPVMLTRQIALDYVNKKNHFGLIKGGAMQIQCDVWKATMHPVSKVSAYLRWNDQRIEDPFDGLSDWLRYTDDFIAEREQQRDEVVSLDLLQDSMQPQTVYCVPLIISDFDPEKGPEIHGLVLQRISSISGRYERLGVFVARQGSPWSFVYKRAGCRRSDELELRKYEHKTKTGTYVISLV
jgi:hypothetical protein